MADTALGNLSGHKLTSVAKDLSHQSSPWLNCLGEERGRNERGIMDRSCSCLERTDSVGEGEGARDGNCASFVNYA